MTSPFLVPRYENSRALVIGINKYNSASPLEFACSDAEAIAELLISQLDFPVDNVHLLLDKDATRAGIIKRYLEFTTDEVGANDRVIVYFAGHGFTRKGHRGEVGYLLPCDGAAENPETLIRWDDFTRNCDLIAAKHVLFVMDACYGGTALSRAPSPGSMRFLKDMLQRRSRQVLTAGKADEVVADAGGPLAGHSLFTGHFIQALQGEAATSDGVVTANGIMSYVYDKVAKDHHSRQTPHYGYLEGDGDFLFNFPIIQELDNKPEIDQDVLISVPPSASAPVSTEFTTADVIKECIAEPRFRIRLHDTVVRQVRNFNSRTSEDAFKVHTSDVTTEMILERFEQYEDAIAELQSTVICLAHWGTEEHRSVLRKAMARTTDIITSSSGLVLWLKMRWYPSLVLMYSAGMAAIAAENYDNLKDVFLEKAIPDSDSDNAAMIVGVTDGILDLDRMDVFKRIPGHERHYVAKSEYLFKQIQPKLDDILYVGRVYEEQFDRFEILAALVYAHLRRGWGPPGRFAWKHHSRLRSNSPFTALVDEAKSLKESWPPIRAGLFDGSFDRFMKVAERYNEQVLNKLNWF